MLGTNDVAGLAVVGLVVLLIVRRGDLRIAFKSGGKSGEINYKVKD